MEVADPLEVNTYLRSNPNAQHPPFPTLIGEHTLLISKTADGNAMVTNFRFCVCERRLFINIPLMMVGELLVNEATKRLRIGCKYGSTYSCTFATAEDCRACTSMLREMTGLPQSPDDLFAYRFYSLSMYKESLRTSLTKFEKENISLCQSVKAEFAYNFETEVERLGFDTRSSGRIWRISQANESFEFCPTYSKLHIIPATVDDDKLKVSLDFRALKRFPSVVWRDKRTGMVLIRSSQPMSSFLGLSYFTNHADVSLIEEIVNACNGDLFAKLQEEQRQSGHGNVVSGRCGHESSQGGNSNTRSLKVDGAQGSPLSDTSPVTNGCDASSRTFSCGDSNVPKKLAIVDCRSLAGVWGNSFKGGGTEDEVVYKCNIVHLDLANIHTVRDSFHKLRALCHSCVEGTFFKNLTGCMWLTYISALLRGANIVVELLYVMKRPVLVHCSDGWDRTSQIVSLSELMMDSYYRTLQGFQVLVEREWLHFGHKFGERGGHDPNCSDMNQISPVFLQFLDCVHQLILQYPAEFQFNEAYLVKLLEHSQACLFGNFLHNCQKEREKCQRKTASVWTLLRPDKLHFVNLLYKPSDQVLTAKFSEHDMVLWKSVYMPGLSPLPHIGQTDFCSDHSPAGYDGDLTAATDWVSGSKLEDDQLKISVDSGFHSPGVKAAAATSTNGVHNELSASECIHVLDESTDIELSLSETSDINFKDSSLITRFENATLANFENSHKEKENGCSEQESSCSEQENGHSKQENSHSEQENSHSEQKNSHSEQENSHSEQENSHSEQENSHSEQENGCSEKENGCSEKENGCSKEKNGCSKEKNGCREKENGCSKKENGCREKKNGCSEEENGCSKKENGCREKENGCSEKENGYSELENSHTDEKNSQSELESSHSEKKNSHGEKENGHSEKENLSNFLTSGSDLDVSITQELGEDSATTTTQELGEDSATTITTTTTSTSLNKLEESRQIVSEQVCLNRHCCEAQHVIEARSDGYLSVDNAVQSLETSQSAVFDLPTQLCRCPDEQTLSCDTLVSDHSLETYQSAVICLQTLHSWNCHKQTLCCDTLELDSNTQVMSADKKPSLNNSYCHFIVKKTKFGNIARSKSLDNITSVASLPDSITSKNGFVTSGCNSKQTSLLMKDSSLLKDSNVTDNRIINGISIKNKVMRIRHFSNENSWHSGRSSNVTSISKDGTLRELSKKFVVKNNHLARVCFDRDTGYAESNIGDTSVVDFLSGDSSVVDYLSGDTSVVDYLSGDISVVDCHIGDTCLRRSLDSLELNESVSTRTNNESVATRTNKESVVSNTFTSKVGTLYPKSLEVDVQSERDIFPSLKNENSSTTTINAMEESNFISRLAGAASGASRDVSVVSCSCEWLDSHPLRHLSGSEARRLLRATVATSTTDISDSHIDQPSSFRPAISPTDQQTSIRQHIDVDGLTMFSDNRQDLLAELFAEKDRKIQDLQDDLTQALKFIKALRSCSCKKQLKTGIIFGDLQADCPDGGELPSVGGLGTTTSNISCETDRELDGNMMLLYDPHSILSDARFYIEKRLNHCCHCGRVFCSVCSSCLSLYPNHRLNKQERVCRLCHCNFLQLSPGASSDGRIPTLEADG